MYSTVKDTHSSLTASTARSNLHNLFDWLCPPDNLSNYHEALKQRQEGTGLWFLNSRMFHAWKGCAQPMLWLHGSPGCGKTVLTSSIVENINNSPAAAVNVTFFYFDFNDSRKQTLDSALRSICHQISLQSEQGAQVLSTFYNRHKDGRQTPSLDSLRECFDSLVVNTNRTQLVLDALDECTTRPHLLNWIRGLKQHGSTKLQLIATSRRELDIDTCLSECIPVEAIVAIQPEVVDADIRTYVRTRLRSDPELDRWQGRTEQQEMEDVICTQAEGM